jgi:hypothetical protein
VYAVFVVCLVLVVAGLAGGTDYALDIVRDIAPGILLFAAYTAILAITWRHSQKAAVILYLPWLVAGAVIGVKEGDRETIEALWGLGLVGFVLLLVVVVSRKRRRHGSPPPASRRLPG